MSEGFAGQNNLAGLGRTDEAADLGNGLATRNELPSAADPAHRSEQSIACSDGDAEAEPFANRMGKS